jgi:ribosomal protein L40E
MKGPLNVIRRRRADRGGRVVVEAGTPQSTTEAPTAVQPTEPVPAGSDPVPSRPTFRDRGRLRRRLRYLRRIRELGFRDLGGLVFDQHKFSQPDEGLVRSKLDALAGVDTELRALEHALDDRRAITELREPGISACLRCGALHGSDARFCPSCGVPLRGPRAFGGVGEAISLQGSAPPPAAEPAGAAMTTAAEPAGAAMTTAAKPSPEPSPEPEAGPEPQPQPKPAPEPEAGLQPEPADPAPVPEPEPVAQPSGERSEP